MVETADKSSLFVTTVFFPFSVSEKEHLDCQVHGASDNKEEEGRWRSNQLGSVKFYIKLRDSLNH